jgi:phage gp36-like protein
MAYCTGTDIAKYLDSAAVIALSDDDADGVADTTVINEAIAAADAEIDGYLGSHYSTPISSVPAIVRRISAKLAIYNIYLRRPEAEMPVKWEAEIKDVRRMLDLIARGTMQLGTPASAGETGDVVETARTVDEATMTMENLSGF